MRKVDATVTTKQVNSAGFDVLETLSSVDSKLCIIRHSIVHVADQVGGNVLYATVSLIGEMERSLKQISNYCEEADGLLFPLTQSLKDMYPDETDLFNHLWDIDDEKQIQCRFIKDLHEVKLIRNQISIEKQ